MSILQVNCGVWQRLSPGAQVVLSDKHSIGLALPEACKGVLDDKFKLKPICVPCEKREERR